MMRASRAEQNSTSTSVANIPGKFATIGAFSPHVLPQRVAFYAKRFAKSQSPKICKLTLGGFTLHKKDKRNDRPPISHR